MSLKQAKQVQKDLQEATGYSWHIVHRAGAYTCKSIKYDFRVLYRAGRYYAYCKQHGVMICKAYKDAKELFSNVTNCS